MTLFQTSLDLGATVITHTVNIILIFSPDSTVSAAGTCPNVGAESLAEGTIIVEILEQEQVLLRECLTISDVPWLCTYICLYLEVHDFPIIVVRLLPLILSQSNNLSPL